MRHFKKIVLVIVGFLTVTGLGLLLVTPTLTQPQPMDEESFHAIAQGYELLMEGKYDAAAAQFKKATEKDNTNPFALNNLAAIAGQKGDYQGAMALLQQAAASAPKYKQKVAQTCFVAGLLYPVKPVKEIGTTSSIAPIIQDNIAKIKEKMERMSDDPQGPTWPPKMEKKR